MKHTRDLVLAAVIAALYATLTWMQNLLLPGSASMAVQFRLAEALCVLALFTPAAIGGLTLGCVLANLLSAAALPLDFFVGTAASFLSAFCMYRLRGVLLWKKLPVCALLMPALWNALLVGGELTVYLGESPFWLNALLVGAGELAVLFTAGLALYFALSHPKLNRQLFGR